MSVTKVHGDDRPRAVLFDLGGVLIELTGEAVLSRWMGGASLDELWRRWLTSPAVRAFETGRCPPQEFAATIVTELALPVTPEVFLEVFTAWPKGWLPGATELVAELHDDVFHACLSNSNHVHWERFREELDIEQRFDACFPSHHLGTLKPDRVVFEQVLSQLPFAPEAVLFLDDNQINVDGARAAGLRAEHVRGVDSAREVLARYDCF
jgi:putative hydrolase of the HAD superfamily